jgi:ABC-2 type transport system permease protein
VKYRDVIFVWEVVIQGGFYATPILYSLSLVPVRFRGWLLLNPLAQIIQDARHAAVTKTTITVWDVLRDRYAIIPILLVGLMVILATLYFKKQSKNFAENI